MAFLNTWSCDNCGKFPDRANFEFSSSWYIHSNLTGKKHYCSLECMVAANAS